MNGDAVAEPIEYGELEVKPCASVAVMEYVPTPALADAATSSDQLPLASTSAVCGLSRPGGVAVIDTTSPSWNPAPLSLMVFATAERPLTGATVKPVT